MVYRYRICVTFIRNKKPQQRRNIEHKIWKDVWAIRHQIQSGLSQTLEYFARQSRPVLNESGSLEGSL